MDSKIIIQRIKKSQLADIDFSKLAFGRTFSDHMFVMNYDNGAWETPEIKPYQALEMMPATSVLHYSQTVFEGMKAYKYKGDNANNTNKTNQIGLFRPEENIQRMNKSAVRINMPEIPENIFLEGLRQLVSLDKGWIPPEDGGALYVRPFMIATDSCIGVRASDRYTFIIFTCPVNAYYTEPLEVKIESHFIRASTGGMGAAKTGGNYAGSLYPMNLAKKEGYHQLIWTDSHTHEYIEESGTMNLMFIKNDTIITPPVSDSILDGITRKSVLKLADSMNIATEVRPVKVQELIEGLKEGTVTEAFGVGTAATIAKIMSIGMNQDKYQLPKLENSIGDIIYEQLEGIKRGIFPDLFNWMEIV